MAEKQLVTVIVDGDTAKDCLFAASKEVDKGADIVLFRILNDNGRKTDVYILLSSRSSIERYCQYPVDWQKLELSILRPLWDSRPNSNLHLDGVLPAFTNSPQRLGKIDPLLILTLEPWQLELLKWWCCRVSFTGLVEATTIAQILGLEVAVPV